MCKIFTGGDFCGRSRSKQGVPLDCDRTQTPETGEREGGVTAVN